MGPDISRVRLTVFCPKCDTRNMLREGMSKQGKFMLICHNCYQAIRINITFQAKEE